MTDVLPGVSPTMRAFIAMTRDYMRDMPELNRLTAGQESSDRQIAWAVFDALSDFNGTPPLIGNYSLETLLDNYQQHSLLLRMTVCALIESIGLLQTRNHVNYSNGGLNIGANDKTPMLMEWLRMYRSYIEQRKQQVKVALNIKSALGPNGVASEYWSLNNTYATY